MKNIFVAGCSHVSGHGFEDCIDRRSHSKHAWPAKIIRDFHYNVINFSCGGISPIYSTEKLQNYKEKNKLDAIMVLLSYRHRYIYNYVENEENVDHHYYAGNFPNNRFGILLKSYYKYCHSDKTDLINFVSYAGYFHYISKEYNIPLWISTVDQKDFNLLKEHNINLTSEFSWNEFCNNHNFPRLPDMHFGHKAHEAFYQRYIKPWIQKL